MNTSTLRPTKYSESTIAALRALMPMRPLAFGEAHHYAEQQATRLLELSKVTGPAVPDSIITELPRVQVERRSPIPMSGYAEWTKGSWRIVTNASEPLLRQRFSLAHELKHIIDHPFIHIAYPPRPGVSSQHRAETICDYFAANLLMPKAWVKRAYYDQRIQEIARLAQLFAVSQMAMRVRLLQLGLIEPLPRCEPYLRSSGLVVLDAATNTIASHSYRAIEQRGAA